MTVVPASQEICLVTAPNPVTALNWENALRAEGIQSQLLGDIFDVGNGDGSEMQPEIWIMRQDVIRAKRVLRQCAASETKERIPKELAASENVFDSRRALRSM